MERNFSLFLRINETNNICTKISEDKEEDHFKFSCFERHPIFALLTLLFIYLPSGSTVSSIFGLSLVGTFYAIILLFLLIPACFILYYYHRFQHPATLFWFLLLVLCFSLLYPRNITSKPSNVGWCQRFLSDVRRIALSFTYFWTFPLFFAVSPFLIVLLKFRSILPHNIYVLKLKCSLSLGESLLEATPQLILQFYIVLTRFGRGTSSSQWVAIAASLLSLSIPAIETFLDNKKMHGFKYIGTYFPVFFLNMFFRVLSVSITSRFLGTSCLIVIFFLFVVFGIFKYYPNWSPNNVQRIAEFFESSILSPITISNLRNTREARSARKWSTYWITGLHITTLLIIMIFCNLGVDVEIDIDIWWSDLPLVEHYLDYLNILIILTITTGLGSLLLDFCVYKHCLHSPVFCDQLELEEEFCLCYYCCMGTMGCLKSAGKD